VTVEAFGGGAAAGEVREVLERTLRPSPVTGVRVDPVLTAVLLAELLTPSSEIWMVSAWISDVRAVDNTRGEYDSLFGDAAARLYSLSEVLGLLTVRGSRLTVVTRDVTENDLFLTRLGRAADPKRLHAIRSPDVHEKTFCGGDWLLSGSMNFTVNGMSVNDEVVTYKLDTTAAAQARIELAHRWVTS
jgi:phosphatidylserine/phosphatidylglycerophosphate/cardiolipin synthase-like enzyme